MSFGNIKKAVLLKLALLSFIPALTPVSSAEAGWFSKGSPHCKDVYVSVKNETGTRINILDLHYYDPARQKWYSEPISNEIIPDQQHWSVTRRLEQVNKKNTRLSIRYRVDEGDGTWSKTIDQWAPSRFVCDNGDQYTFSVNKTAPGK